MRNSAMSSRPILALLFGGLLLTACCITGSHSAAAFSMGGFGGRPMGGGPMMAPRPRGGGGPITAPRPGAGISVGRPPGEGGGGGPPRNPPFIGGGGGYVSGGGGGSPVGRSNSG